MRGEDVNVRHSRHKFKISHVPIAVGFSPQDKTACQVRRDSGAPQVGGAVWSPLNSPHPFLACVMGSMP